jgi:hypothetical protein
MGVHYRARLHFGVQIKMTVGWAEIAETRLEQLELVESMYVLVFAALKRGAEAVQGLCSLCMITSMFLGPGPLVCALVPVEMLQLGAAPASRVGAMLASMLAARKCRAEVKWMAQVAGLSALVQSWLGNEGPVKSAPLLAEMLVLLAAVLETVGTHRKALSKVRNCPAAVVQAARSAGMQVPWSIRQYLALQMEMTAELVEMSEMASEQLGLVGLLLALVFAAVDCGAEGIQCVHLLGKVTSMFWGLGRLACVLAQAEMFPPCVAPAVEVGPMLALASAARNRCAGSKWAARAVGLCVLVQWWLERLGLMKDAPVSVEMSKLLAAVCGKMGMDRKVESEVTKCHAAMVRETRKPGMEGIQCSVEYVLKSVWV